MILILPPHAYVHDMNHINDIIYRLIWECMEYLREAFRVSAGRTLFAILKRKKTVLNYA